MNVYWFNPENDIALGLDARGGFTPPRAAVALRQAGALLPLLWAGEDDWVLVTDPVATDDPRVVTRVPAGSRLTPWGWSRYASDRFRRCGAISAQLPTEERLNEWRRLSHRATATAVLRAMWEDETLIPVVADSVEKAFGAIELFGGKAMVKLPWSCSGRGVMPVGERADARGAEELVRGMIRRQGSVTVEPYLQRVRDFATLYYKEGEAVSYRGLSLFNTDSAGNYMGNIVAPQPELERMLGLETAPVVERLQRALAECLPGYDGWVGVDMMEHELADGRRLIAPCIEVNLRMTMGVAALLASDSPLFHSMGVERALLRVAPPGAILPAGSHTFAVNRCPSGEPLRKPAMALTIFDNC